ncbi:substrate-binding periplasmic protein [Vreelandella lutescens]|uniref:Amino acid ABC transporter substrate-binding protein n=1 Tax=Vreelandella lutescens TaxID=1602943 RepID=A0ABQ1NWP4_9GAMM|nr:transporter substrate-binding domain-containing protein [Halomonas lutescens]GGC86358.1 amino acid ABC transporter substrate-binding protein [Halomonas lutescens]
MAHGNIIKKRLLATLSLLLGCVWLIASLSADRVAADDSTVSLASLTFITEEYPPYNYLEGDRLAGTSIDLLQAMLAHTDTPLDRRNIRYYPWVRGYELALHRPNTVLFSTTRTASRESRFKWIGPIAQDHVVLLARQGANIQVASVEDAIEQGLSVAVIREDIGAQALIEAGYPDTLVRPAIDNRSALHMLLHERVDLWAYSTDVAKWIAEQADYPSDIVEPLYTLSESYLYFAINPDTDPQLVAQLQQAFERATSLSLAVQAGGDG